MKVLCTMVCFILFFSLVSFGQERNCGSMEVLDRQIKENPSMLKNMEEIEKQVQEYIRNNANGNGQRAIITIPTVVHVVYRTTTENISDAQVQSQIDVLNADFKALNSDLSLTPSLFTGVIGNPEIEFCLATQDPSGNATTGINRKSTTVTSWGTNDNVKKTAQGGVDPWNAANYLNIWVCNIGGGILGYAQFPGGPASTDGVVLDYRYTGTLGTATAPYHKGRTGTHEVGHWLNLRHIWGDATCGSDLVSDTPVHNTSNGGCPAYPHYSTCSGAPVEMTMNYMDYTYDACMYMFSQGQKTRMRAVLEGSGSRSSLQSSPGCLPPSPRTCNAPAGLATSNITATTATSSWTAVSSATSYTFEFKLNSATTWTATTVTTTAVNLTGLTASTAYNTRVRSNCASGPSSYATTVNFTTTAVPSNCTDTYENNNSRNQAKTIPVGSSTTAKIGTSTDKDWFKFSNTSSARNVRVTMSNLPADYDMILYRGNSQVGISENADNNDEQVTYNNTQAAATYYVQVYGYNGAFNNTLCYTLLAERSGSAYRLAGEELNLQAEAVKDELLIFPNPASNEITVVVPFGEETDGVLSIMDFTGKVISAQSLIGDKNIKTYEMDLSEFNGGLYFVNFRTSSSTYTQKLVITDKH
jgi:hypothetical protein